MTTDTGREKLKEKMIFCTLRHTHTFTHTLDFHYHFNWWGNDVSNNMLNTGVSLYPPESFVLGKDSIWCWIYDNVIPWRIWTLNDLPDKIIHHIWNVLWQSPRDGYCHDPTSISQKAQPRSQQRLRADDWWVWFISRPNINREESFKLKCDQRWQLVWTAVLHLLNMQPFSYFWLVSAGENNVIWA